MCRRAACFQSVYIMCLQHQFLFFQFEVSRQLIVDFEFQYAIEGLNQCVQIIPTMSLTYFETFVRLRMFLFVSGGHGLLLLVLL